MSRLGQSTEAGNVSKFVGRFDELTSDVLVLHILMRDIKMKIN